MNIIFLKIRSWENSHYAKCSQSFKTGDLVIVETEDGLESAIVEKIDDWDDSKMLIDNFKNKPNKIKVIRKATLRDLNTIKEHKKKEADALRICREEAKKIGLPMKIVGASYSFDGGTITFAFTADGRVDFRELVKNLSKKFQRSIRLYQIGARDEARSSGGYGLCGRELCCIHFNDNLPSISSEMARAQQIFHRGSERISGLCGRLMCCLAYEAQQYQEMLDQMPEVGQEVKFKDGKGIVKKVNALSGLANVEIDKGNILTIPIDKIK